MAYEALEELLLLTKDKVEDKDIPKSKFKALLRTIAETGHLPHTEESLDSAVDLIFRDIKKYKRGGGGLGRFLDGYKLWIGDIDEVIYKAGKKHNLHFRPEQMVERIIARTIGKTENSENFKKKAFEIIKTVKNEMKRRKPETLGAATIYIASNRELTQMEICNYSFCLGAALRNVYQEIGKRHPQYSLVPWKERNL